MRQHKSPYDKANLYDVSWLDAVSQWQQNIPFNTQISCFNMLYVSAPLYDRFHNALYSLKHGYVWMFIVSFNLPVVCSQYAFNKINSLRFARDRVPQLQPMTK